jgi:hypothetical protein
MGFFEDEASKAAPWTVAPLAPELIGELADRALGQSLQVSLARPSHRTEPVALSMEMPRRIAVGIPVISLRPCP